VRRIREHVVLSAQTCTGAVIDLSLRKSRHGSTDGHDHLGPLPAPLSFDGRIRTGSGSVPFGLLEIIGRRTRPGRPKHEVLPRPRSVSRCGPLRDPIRSLCPTRHGIQGCDIHNEGVICIPEPHPSRATSRGLVNEVAPVVLLRRMATGFTEPTRSRLHLVNFSSFLGHSGHGRH